MKIDNILALIAATLYASIVVYVSVFDYLYLHIDITDIIASIAAILLVIFVTAKCVNDIRRPQKKRAAAKALMLRIKRKGYPWAIIPQHPYNYKDSDKTYVLATEEKLEPIGAIPDGQLIYQTSSGSIFFSPFHANVKAIIDVAGNVYLNSFDLARSKIALSRNLIIPKGYHVIRDRQEAEDFFDFRHSLFVYLKRKDTIQVPDAKLRENDIAAIRGET